MSIKKLFQTEEERAVSPVIGVILMVAITVILAAVIGMFVLGMGDSLGDGAAPNAQLSMEADGGDLIIEHNGGDDVDPNEVTIKIGGEDVTDNMPTDTLSTAGEWKITTTKISAAEVVIIHDSSNNILTEATVGFSSS